MLTAGRRVGFEPEALLGALEFGLPRLVVAAGTRARFGRGQADVDGPDAITFSPLQVELTLPVSELGFGAARSVLLEDVDLGYGSFRWFHVASFLRL